LMPI
jgi:hypothetical protein